MSATGEFHLVSLFDLSAVTPSVTTVRVYDRKALANETASKANVCVCVTYLLGGRMYCRAETGGRQSAPP